MHRKKITTKTVKLSWDIQNQHYMPISEVFCTFFCEMSKISEYLMVETDNKNLPYCFLPFHSTLTMQRRQKYQFKVLDAFMILYLKLYNYYNQETIKT